MATYRVSIPKTIFVSFDVEAEDQEEAIDLAFDDDRMPGDALCAQCSGWGRDFTIDENEWDVAKAKAEPKAD